MLTIYGITDTHGDDNNIGFLLKTILKDKNYDENQSILTCSGDALGISRTFSSISNAEFDIEVFEVFAKQFQHKFFVPGNHDVFYGDSVLTNFIQTTGFETVINNVDFSVQSKVKDNVNSSAIVREINKKKVAVLGIMTPESLNATKCEESFSKIEQLKETKKRVEAEIQKLNNPDLIIINSHYGLDDDIKLAEYLAGNNYKNIIIMGGHSHTTTHTLIERINEQGSVWVGNGGCHGDGLLKLQLDFSGKKLKVIGEFVTTDFSQTEHPGITQVKEKYLQEALQKLNITKEDFYAEHFIAKETLIGAEPITQGRTNHLRIQDTAVTRLTCDAIEHFAKPQLKKDNVVVLFPSGGIRTDFQKGNVTYKNLLENYIANNRMVVLEATGKELIQALHWGILSDFKFWRGRFLMLHSSANLSYQYNTDNVNNPENILRAVYFNNYAINPDQTFTIVTTDFAQLKLFPKNEISKKWEDILIPEMVRSYCLELKKGNNGQLPEISETHQNRIISIESLKTQEQRCQTVERGGGIPFTDIACDFNLFEQAYNNDNQAPASFSTFNNDQVGVSQENGNKAEPNMYSLN